MFELEGKYETAVVFIDDIETEAISQIYTLLEQPFMAGTHPRFMPDVHAGKGCTIGTTMHIKDEICPNLVGVDIGCGMFVVELDRKIENFAKLDEIIHRFIPAGQNVHERAVRSHDIASMACYSSLFDPAYLQASIGSLGGGNHFIEIDETEDGKHMLVIHSGSRNLGKQVCKHYMDIAHQKMGRFREELDIACRNLIERLKEEHRERDINTELQALKKEYTANYGTQNKDLATIRGNDLADYLHDMKICQDYARKNRETMAEIILDKLFGTKLSDYEHWHCVHNYIDVENRILRKGSISAAKGEKVIIPLNMRDGCIIGYGKGNPEWNFSGPHGAGRKMSRSAAKQNLTVEDFKASMDGIFSTTVDISTIDEAPVAYKDAEGIIENIQDTVEVSEIVKPVYNFKASSL